MFFLLNKFRWAELSYKKAVELKEERIPARYLLADALIHQGKFEEASKELEIYLKETTKPASGAILNKWLADYLFAEFGNSKRNKIQSNNFIEKAINSKNLQEQKSLLSEAIREDPISNLAWFNYTVCLHSTLEQEDFNSLLIAVILNPLDIDLHVTLIVQLFRNLDLTKENFNYFHLAILNESWKYKLEIEDDIRNRLPEKGATEFLKGIEQLVKEANLIYLGDIPIALRNF